MARSTDQIVQRITLEGAEEVKKQLAEMGKAGEDAIKAIDRATAATTGGMGNFARGIAAANTQVKALGASLAPVGEAFRNAHEHAKIFSERMASTADRIIPHFKEVLGLATAGSLVALVAMARFVPIAPGNHPRAG